MAEILQLRKGLIIWVAFKGRGFSITFTVLHKMPHYFMIYYKISFVATISNGNNLVLPENGDKWGLYLEHCNTLCTRKIEEKYFKALKDILFFNGVFKFFNVLNVKDIV